MSNVANEAAAFLLEEEFGQPQSPTPKAVHHPEKVGNARTPDRTRDEATLAGRVRSNENLLATVWNDTPQVQDGAEALMDDSSTMELATSMVRRGRPTVRRPQPMSQPKQVQQPSQQKVSLDDLSPEQLQRIEERLDNQLTKVRERLWSGDFEEEAIEDEEVEIDPYAARQEGWTEGYAAAEASLREEYEQQLQQAALQTEWLVDDEETVE